MANIGWLFAKDYYKDIVTIRGLPEDKQPNEYSNKNQEIKGKTFSNYRDEFALQQLSFSGVETFKLTTIYPGLLTGSGIPHESNTKGEFKIGFSFDYTTGLPVIPGSSVKGVLRSAFAPTNYIDYLFEDINNSEQVNAGALEKEIFDGIRTGADGSETDIPLYDRDIFFDAVISASGNTNGKFLDEDFITPHKFLFKDPVPLLFLKVLPRVTFSFQFRLKNGLITKDDKLKLFETIIRDLGVGAKTNVGYGKFA